MEWTLVVQKYHSIVAQIFDGHPPDHPMKATFKRELLGPRKLDETAHDIEESNLCLLGPILQDMVLIAV